MFFRSLSRITLPTAATFALLLAAGQMTTLWATPPPAGDSLFPLTTAELADETTLKPQVISESYVEPTPDANRKLRWVEVRFFSHDWKDGRWFGKIHVVIPEPIAEDRQGLVVMCPMGSGHIQQGIDMRRDFFEQTARHFGIPVVSIPAVGEHFGHSQIHAMSDHLIMKFLDTGDPSWLPGYATCAVRSRTLTMVGHLTGHPVEQAIHLGSSISAHQAWIWPLYDRRVKAIIATGDVGFQRDKYPADRSFKRAKRPVFEAISKAGADLQTRLLEHTDPYLFGARLKCRVLQIAGTKDFASPPSTVDYFLQAIAGPTHLVYVPNYAHGTGSRRHLKAYRMWIDHVFFGRPISSVKLVNASYTGGQVTVTARLPNDAPQVQHVQFVYATSSEPDFLRSRFLKSTPRNNHVQAKWKTVPMERRPGSDNEWTATFRPPGPASSFVAGFVDVEDQAGTTKGYAASRMIWLEREFVSLFDGKTLDGWQGATDVYTAEDGILVCKEHGADDRRSNQNLFTRREYGDFILRFEFRLTPGANNGIAIRSPLQGRPSRDGLEIQILDDSADRYRKLAPHQFNGSVYLLAPAKRGHLRPVGQWNQEEIRAEGSRIQVTLNGVAIVDVDLDHPQYTKYLELSKGRTRRRGHIGFCGHSSRVEFRNIRIKEL